MPSEQTTDYPNPRMFQSMLAIFEEPFPNELESFRKLAIEIFADQNMSPKEAVPIWVTLMYDNILRQDIFDYTLSQILNIVNKLTMRRNVGYARGFASNLNAQDIVFGKRPMWLNPTQVPIEQVATEVVTEVDDGIPPELRAEYNALLEEQAADTNITADEDIFDLDAESLMALKMPELYDIIKDNKIVIEGARNKVNLQNHIATHFSIDIT